MKWKNVLIMALFMVGMAMVSIVDAATTSLRDKPAGHTREQAMYEALKDTMNTNGTIREQALTPAADGSTASVVLPGTTSVNVGAVTNDANDWILLPSLSAVPVGHAIKVGCNAGGNFEVRTPAASDEKINTVDADGGSAEYLCVDTELTTFTKVSDADGWVGLDITALGAVGTPTTVPD